MAGEAPRIRAAGAADLPALEVLYASAFPEEDLLGLVHALAGTAEARALVAILDDRIVGHVVLTSCALPSSRLPGEAAHPVLLGPLAVAPAEQGRGLGSALVRAALERARAAGAPLVLVLGDPGYYGRFGFRPEAQVAPPFPLPEIWANAWQSLALSPGHTPLRGRLQVPPAWSRGELWGP